MGVWTDSGTLLASRRISGKALAAGMVGTATRTISQPAVASARICRTVASISVVSVFVIDWMERDGGRWTRDMFVIVTDSLCEFLCIR